MGLCITSCLLLVLLLLFLLFIIILTITIINLTRVTTFGGAQRFAGMQRDQEDPSMKFIWFATQPSVLVFFFGWFELIHAEKRFLGHLRIQEPQLR